MTIIQKGERMSDLIDRQAAIDRATKEHDFFRGAVTVSDKARRDELLNVMCWLGELPPIQPEPHWIPVEQALPEEDTDVLVTVHFLGLKRTHRNGWNEHIKESFYVEVASYINGEWSSASDEYKIARDRHKVIAWMPLPESYKGVTT